MGLQVALSVHACQGYQRPEASCLPMESCPPSQCHWTASSAQSQAFHCPSFHWELVGILQKVLDEVEGQIRQGVLVDVLRRIHQEVLVEVVRHVRQEVLVEVPHQVHQEVLVGVLQVVVASGHKHPCHRGQKVDHSLPCPDLHRLEVAIPHVLVLQGELLAEV